MTEARYHDVPMLKPAVWTWEVAAYFFLGGISAGAWLLARAAAGRLPTLSRVATYVAQAAVLPCPPLLISDLGDASRFHHMMRVFKPESPMSLGSWTLLGYSAVSSVATLRHLLRVQDSAATALFEDGLGIPLALLLASYTGVLLSCTATPVWTRNAWLPVLTATSAFHGGCAATALGLELATQSEETERAIEVLDRVDAITAAAKSVALAGSLYVAKPYITESMKKKLGARLIWGGIGCGLVLPRILKSIGRRLNRPRTGRVAGNAVALVGTYVLRHLTLEVGKLSALDPDSARRASSS